MLKTLFFSLYSLAFFAYAQPNTPDKQGYTIVEDKSLYPLQNPVLKNRKTAKIVLDNGVEAYLISDPDTDQSAAAVTMEAGSWNDPIEYPGTAHFLEHMLFMGTEAYPDESSYMQYIQENGGNVNAYTAADHTVYMFSINNPAFVHALDQFSHFFIDPLFSPSCIQRELHAVDQEHSKNIENDFWREYMVLKETSLSDHPYAKFSTGNAKTLGGIPQSVLKKWYETHYSADKLHLVMISPLPLEEMIQLATSKFSLVARRATENNTKSYGPFLSPEQKGHILYVQPIKDIQILSILWELPEELCAIEESGTIDLLRYALSHSSKLGLLQELKNSKLAEDLAVSKDLLSKKNGVFRIDIELTELGVSQLDTVILRCYQTLARLKEKSIPLSLFQERQTLSKIRYQYQAKQDLFAWITATADDLTYENLSTFPEKSYVLTDFNPSALSQLLSALTPSSATYVLLADMTLVGIQPDHKEKWMNVEYTIQAIPPAKLALWRQAAPHPEIDLPPSNPFVPTSLELITAPEASDPSAPAKLVDSEKMRVYFTCDQAYKTPETSLLFSLYSPLLNGSAKTAVCMDLFCKILEDNLSETLFFARAAGLYSKFSFSQLSLRISLSGYSQKAPELALAIFSQLHPNTLFCSEDSFSLYKASLANAYANTQKELPVSQAAHKLFYILSDDAPMPQDKLNVLQEISLDDFIIFYQDWARSLYLEGIIYGNTSRETAQELCTGLENTLSFAQGYANPAKPHFLTLPANKGPFKIEESTDRQGHGAVLLVQQGPFSFRKEASQQLLATVLQESFFDTLRTKQQTGYIATTWAFTVDKQLQQVFAVQSGTHLPSDLLLRFELFLEDFTKRILDIVPKERFEHLKQVQIASLTIPPSSLYDMASYLQQLAFVEKGDFSYTDKKIEAMRSLSYEELLADAQEFFDKHNRKRLAILLQGQQLEPNKTLLYEETNKAEVIKIASFPRDSGQN